MIDNVLNGTVTEEDDSFANRKGKDTHLAVEKCLMVKTEIF
jgi:hypothetical protein